jgi:hypothetical protein
VIIEQYYYTDLRLAYNSSYNFSEYHLTHWFDLTPYRDMFWEVSLVYTNMVSFDIMDEKVYLTPDGTITYMF